MARTLQLTNLDRAVERSGLVVKKLPGWDTNKSNGEFDPGGVLVHHTGSYDGLFDGDSDYDYAMWLAFEGRRDLPPPLCNLALAAEGVVYLAASGNANHAGEAKASGPMPAALDGAVIYIGIEAMNSGYQGWDSKAWLADGTEITYFEAYARLCASLCYFYGWPASHVRGHKETSVTGKWDPGYLDMDKFRERIAAILTQWEEEDMASPEEVARALLDTKIEVKRGDRKVNLSVEQALKEIFNNITNK